MRLFAFRRRRRKQVKGEKKARAKAEGRHAMVLSCTQISKVLFLNRIRWIRDLGIQSFMPQLTSRAAFRTNLLFKPHRMGGSDFPESLVEVLRNMQPTDLA